MRILLLNKKRIARLLLLCLCVQLSCVVYAVDYTAVGDGMWANSATWSPNGVPGEYDNVTIPNGKTVTCEGELTHRGNIDVDGVLKFNVDLYYRGEGANKIKVENGGRLEVGNIFQLYGRVENSGDIEVKNSEFQMWAGCSFQNAGKVIVFRGQTLMADGAIFVNDGTLNMYGQFTMNGGNPRFTGSGTTNMYGIFETVAGSVYDMTGVTNLIGGGSNKNMVYLSRSKFNSHELNVSGDLKQVLQTDNGTISADIFEIDNSSIEGVYLQTEMHVKNQLKLTNGMLTLDCFPLYLDGDNNEIVGGGVRSYINSISYVDHNCYFMDGNRRGSMFYRKMNDVNKWYEFPVGENGFYCPAQLKPIVSGQIFGARHYHVGHGASIKNVAKGKMTSASSGNASLAVDGNDDSRWESGSSDPQWFMVDLGKSYDNISKIEILWETAYGKKFTIEVSLDNSNWTEVAAVDNNVLSGGLRQVLNVGNVSARYVRFNGKERATQWGYSFYEFKVHAFDGEVVEGTEVPEVLRNVGGDIVEILKALNTHEYWKIAAADGNQGGVFVSLDYANNGNVKAEPNNYVYAYKPIDKEDGWANDWEMKSAVEYDDANKYMRGTRKITPGEFGCLLAFTTRRSHQWTGLKDSNWFDKDNWSDDVPGINDDAYIEDGAANYPVIVRDGSRIAQINHLLIHGYDAETGVTISDGGSMFCKKNVIVEDDSKSHIVINHRYDKMCNFKVGTTDGSAYVRVGTTTGNAVGEYNKVTVNRTYPSDLLYYTGSATKEGIISDGFDRANGDYIALYNARNEKYSERETASFEGFLGHSLGLVDDGGVTGMRTISQVGTLQVNEYRFTKENGLLKFTQGAPKPYGWNMLTNPHSYAFPLKREEVGAEMVNGMASSHNFPFWGDVVNDNPVIWFRRFNEGADDYFWSTFNLATMTGVSVKSYSQALVGDVDGGDWIIAPNEAFFVKVTNPETNYSWHLVTGFVGVHNMVTTSHLKSETIETDVLRLTVSSDAGKSVDETAMVFREGGSLALIAGDAEKRIDKGANQIFVVKNGENIAIPFYPTVAEVSEEKLPINVILSDGATEGKIRVTNIDNFDAEEVYLTDFESGVTIDMRKVNEYGFVAEGGKEIKGRFAISVKKTLSTDVTSDEGEVATGIMAAKTGIMITLNDNNEAVVAATSDQIGGASAVYVYDMVGRLVVKADMRQEKTVVSLPSRGVYVIKAVGETKTAVAKLGVK